MAQFTMAIAGHTARVTSLFDSTKDYCSRYLTAEAPEFSITVTRENLAFEQDFLLREALEEGIRVRKFTDPFLERAAIQRAFAEYLFPRNALLMHGSTVAVDGNAYLFTAKCGTGKSTHTRLWRQVFGGRAVMVNDDKPFLRITETGVLACGAPWSGKHGLDCNIAVPLKGICVLNRGSENRIRKASPEEVLPLLEKQGCIPLDPGKYPQYLSLIHILAQSVPLWQMECTKEEQAALISHAAMSEDEIN